MKRLIVIVIIQLGLANFSQAQLHDKNWLFGYDGDSGSPYGINQLIFNQDSFELQNLNWPYWLSKTNSCMSDSSGNFLFVSNGAEVFNSVGAIMDNGSGLSPCPYTTEWGPSGLDINQGVLALPISSSENKYVLFHEKLTYAFPDQSFEWNYSKIDMSMNGGLGKVTSKNNVLVSDTMLAVGNVTAVKHGNGKDWWVLKPTRNSNKIYEVLLNENGVSQPVLKTVNFPIFRVEGTSGSWTTFSPDGEHFAQWLLTIVPPNQPNYYLLTANFNRCTGEFYNEQEVLFSQQLALHGPGTIAYSPNNRFLYLSYIGYVYQFDMEASDILGSIDTVAVYDGSHDGGLNYTFYILQPAPDGKIYCSATNSVRVMHVINHPNVKGDCCDFRQHAVQLPAYYYCGLPNFPYFRVGPIDGSSCDTLGLDNIYEPDTTDASYVCDSSLLVSNGMKYPPIANVYPNPANDVLKIATNARQGLEYVATLYSLTGERVMEVSLDRMTTAVNVSEIPNGIYVVEVSNGANQTKVVRKVSVVH